MKTNLDKFIEIYTEHLKHEVETNPQDYFWSISDLPVVVNKMKNAMEKGTFNKDSKAIKKTCKQLNIKHTYTEMRAFFKGDLT